MRQRNAVEMAAGVLVTTVLAAASVTLASSMGGGGSSAASGGGTGHVGGAGGGGGGFSGAPAGNVGVGRAPSGSGSHPVSSTPGSDGIASPSGNESAGSVGSSNGTGRASWRHHDHDGNAYGTPVLPYGYGNDYIVAGSDGYYNGYYGYAAGYPYGNWNNGTVTTGGPNNGGDTDVPANNPSTPPAVPAAPANDAPSAVTTEAQIQNSVKNSPEIVAADALVQRDQQAYDTECRRVIESLRNDPAFQAAVNRRGAAQSQVANIDAHDAVPDPAAVGPVAQAKLQAADDVTRLKEQAIANDPAAAAAKAKLDTDVQKREEIRQQLMAKYQPSTPR